MIETYRSFSALAEEFVEVTLRDDPVAATAAGIHDYDGRLPDDSPDGFRRRVGWLRDLEGRLARGVSEQSQTAAARVDLAHLRSRIAALRCDLEDIRAQTRDPVRYPEAALHGVFLLLARAFAPLEERKEAALSRLMAIPDYLASVRATLEHPHEAAIGLASDVTLGGLAFVDEATRSLVRSFPGEAERIEHAGERARMGLLQYQSFLERDLRQRAGGALGIGEHGMNVKLEREHLLGLDCAALEALGLEEVERTRVLLEEEARRLDPTRPWREQVAEARRRHPEPHRLRDAYRAEVERARRFVEEKRLAPIPEGRLEVIDTPPFERAMVPYAAYLPPAPFDTDQTGHFYVTPVESSRTPEERQQQLEGHCSAGIPITALHESFPGHHLQLLHANRAGSRLRRLSASNLFAEGWALYSEELMGEHGFFTNPLTRLLQLRDLRWRACRVVIDVRLHTGRMSLPQAADLLVEEAMLERVNAEAEVRRYALDPTQPMSYVVGKRSILEIRDEARRRLGPAFDLHDFHAALLAGGTLPPALVKDELWDRIGAV